MAKNFFQIDKGTRFRPQTSAPSDPQSGDFYYDSTLNKFRGYENGAWVNLGEGGSGGVGDTTQITESLINQLADSIYEFVTPCDFKLNSDDLVDDGESTGSYNSTLKIYELDSAEKMQSIQLLDTDFLNDGLDIGQIDLTVFWAASKIDTGATYKVSRDGGVNWQDMSDVMERNGETGQYSGTWVFEEESILSELARESHTGASAVLDDDTQQSLATQFLTSVAGVIKELQINLTKTGSPSGNIWIDIYTNSGVVPGSLIASSKAIAISGISTGLSVFELPSLVVLPVTYHLVFRTDSAYKDSYVASTHQLSIDCSSSGPPGGASKYNGSSWSVFTDYSLNYEINGRELDLRIQLTSSANTKALDAFGIYYNNETGNIITGYKNIEVFKFKAVADNDNEFTLTRFVPDPDLLKCFYVEGGQTFIRPAFELQGSKIVFPVDTFNNGGVEADVTLIFQQLEGSSFDNSDGNALLLAENHLGSQDATLDKSVNGRGIFLRRPDGTMREICIDDSDNIVIYSI